MSNESMRVKTVMKRKYLLMTIAVVFILIPAFMILSLYMGDRSFYVCGVVIIILAMIPFAAAFEGKRPKARELTVIAVMCAIAVISRAAFIMLPQVKPIVGIIIIAGISLGPISGFLTGCVSAFVSNFMFGQGPWTPWQMFAYGMAGFIAGLLSRKGIITPEKRIFVTVFGGLVIMIITGPLLDTCTLFTMSSTINISSALMVYSAGVPFNGVLAASTMATLFILCRPMTEKLDRIKTKYGMMNEDGFI